MTLRTTHKSSIERVDRMQGTSVLCVMLSTTNSGPLRLISPSIRQPSLNGGLNRGTKNKTSKTRLAAVRRIPRILLLRTCANLPQTILIGPFQNNSVKLALKRSRAWFRSCWLICTLLELFVYQSSYLITLVGAVGKIARTWWNQSTTGRKTWHCHHHIPVCTGCPKSHVPSFNHSYLFPLMSKTLYTHQHQNKNMHENIQKTYGGVGWKANKTGK